MLPEALTFIGRQNRASVLADWLLATGPVTEVSAGAVALPDPRILSSTAGRERRARRVPLWADELPKQKWGHCSRVDDNAALSVATGLGLFPRGRVDAWTR